MEVVINPEISQEVDKKIKEKKKELEKLYRDKWMRYKDALPELTEYIKRRYNNPEILEWVTEWGKMNSYVHSRVKRDWYVNIYTRDSATRFQYCYENGTSNIFFTHYGIDYICNFSDGNIFKTAASVNQIKDQIGLKNLQLPLFLDLVKNIVCFVAPKFGAHVDEIFHEKCQCFYCFK